MSKKNDSLEDLSSETAKSDVKYLDQVTQKESTEQK